MEEPPDLNKGSRSGRLEGWRFKQRWETGYCGGRPSNKQLGNLLELIQITQIRFVTVKSDYWNGVSEWRSSIQNIYQAQWQKIR